MVTELVAPRRSLRRRGVLAERRCARGAGSNELRGQRRIIDTRAGELPTYFGTSTLGTGGIISAGSLMGSQAGVRLLY